MELGCWGKLMGERQKVRRVNQVGTLYKLSSLEQQPSENLLTMNWLIRTLWHMQVPSIGRQYYLGTWVP